MKKGKKTHFIIGCFWWILLGTLLGLWLEWQRALVIAFIIFLIDINKRID